MRRDFIVTEHFPLCYNLINEKKDKMSVETQLILFSIGFGYMFRIEPIHNQAFIQNKEQV
jgi:hypothetical protein